MKKLFKFISIITLVTVISGCVPLGIVANQIRGPVAVGNLESPTYSKVGRAKSHSLLGVSSFGDASISTAMANGKIKKIHHVDFEVRSFLLFCTYETIVYGN